MVENSLFLKSVKQSFVDQVFDEIFFNVKNINGILGYSITVYTSADKYTTEHVDQKIEKYLKAFNTVLKKMSEKELDLVKETTKKLWRQYSVDVKQKVEQNWNEITQCEYVFDRLKKQELALKDITINDVKEWFAKDIMNGSNFRKLSIQVAGTNEREKEVEKANYGAEDDKNALQHFVLNYTINDQQDQNMEDYKKNLFVYPAMPTLDDV